MKKLNFIFVKIFILVSCFGTSIVTSMNQLDPSVRQKLTRADLIMDDSPYMDRDNWSLQIESDGEAFTIRCPIKAEVPEEMMVNFQLEINGIYDVKQEMTLCDAFEEEFVISDVLVKGLPVKTFPKACVILPGNNYVIKNAKLPTHKIPPGTPDCKFYASLSIFMPGQKPICTLIFQGDLWHEYPGLG